MNRTTLVSANRQDPGLPICVSRVPHFATTLGLPGLPSTHHGGQKIFWTGKDRLGGAVAPPASWSGVLQLRGDGNRVPRKQQQRDLLFPAAVQMRPPVALACWMQAAQLVVYEQWAGWGWVVEGRAAAGCLVAILRTWSTGFFLKRRKLKFCSSDHAQWWSPWPSSLQP